MQILSILRETIISAYTSNKGAILSKGFSSQSYENTILIYLVMNIYLCHTGIWLLLLPADVWQKIYIFFSNKFQNIWNIRRRWLLTILYWITIRSKQNRHYQIKWLLYILKPGESLVWNMHGCQIRLFALGRKGWRKSLKRQLCSVVWLSSLLSWVWELW